MIECPVCGLEIPPELRQAHAESHRERGDRAPNRWAQYEWLVWLGAVVAGVVIGFIFGRLV